MSLLPVGTVAPAFELLDEEGGSRSLESILANGPVVLFFYPKDGTAICTKEACGFRDDFSEFQKLKAQVIGISRDDAASHRAFKKKNSLPFPLLSDPEGRVADAFGVKRVLGLVPGRATYVVDQEGRVRMSFSSTLGARVHVEEALAAMRAQD